MLRVRALSSMVLLAVVLCQAPPALAEERATGSFFDRLCERFEPQGKVGRFFFLLSEGFLRSTFGAWPRRAVEVEEPFRPQDRALLGKATTFEIGIWEALDASGRALHTVPVTSYRPENKLSWVRSFNAIQAADLEQTADQLIAALRGASAEVATIRYTHYHGPFSLGNPSRFSSLGDKRQSHTIRDYFARKGVKGVRYEMGLLYRGRSGHEGKRLVRMPESPLPWGEANPFGGPVGASPSTKR